MVMVGDSWPLDFYVALMAAIPECDTLTMEISPQSTPNGDDVETWIYHWVNRGLEARLRADRILFRYASIQSVARQVADMLWADYHRCLKAGTPMTKDDQAPN